MLGGWGWLEAVSENQLHGLCLWDSSFVYLLSICLFSDFPFSRCFVLRGLISRIHERHADAVARQ